MLHWRDFELMVAGRDKRLTAPAIYCRRQKPKVLAMSCPMPQAAPPGSTKQTLLNWKR